MKILSVLYLLGLWSNAQEPSAALPVGFPAGAWDSLKTCEGAIMQDLYPDLLVEGGEKLAIKPFSCTVNLDAVTSGEVKYILLIDLLDTSEDMHPVPHRSLQLLDPQGSSVLRIPKAGKTEFNGYYCNGSASLFGANSGVRCLNLINHSSNKLGSIEVPDKDQFIQWRADGSLATLFEYKSVGRSFRRVAEGEEDPVDIYWRTKFLWKDMDGVAGKEIVFRRLVIVRGVLYQKFIEDAVLAWNATKGNFENITASITDVHTKVKDAITHAAEGDVHLAESPGLQYDARDDFESMELETKIAKGDLPVDPSADE